MFDQTFIHGGPNGKNRLTSKTPMTVSAVNSSHSFRFNVSEITVARPHLPSTDLPAPPDISDGTPVAIRSPREFLC
jgi:hypothetical protein